MSMGTRSGAAAAGGSVDDVIRPIVDGLRTAATNFVGIINALAPIKTSGRGLPAHEGCCEREDPCHCNCCIVDANLVVRSRLGEKRIVPLLIENTRRRERQITMALGSWTSAGGRPGPVSARLMPPAPSFTLAACSRQLVLLEMSTPEPKPPESSDVDNCTVYYADLRLEDCARPIRIALALLPRDCGTYEIRCSCCC